MTGDFAIIAEGITDQRVLENIILGFFAAHEEPMITFKQPQLDATGRNAEHAPGGWTLVRKYFQERKHIEVLQTNRFLVVHIDADISEELGVPSVVEGKPRTPAEIVEDIIELLGKLISETIPEKDRDRFLFAIGSDSIECWLLPLVFDRSNKAKLKKTTGCLDAIDHELRKKSRPTLSQGDSKNLDVYRALSEQFTKKTDVEKAAVHNPGFKRFVEQLIPLEATWSALS